MKWSPFPTTRPAATPLPGWGVCRACGRVGSASQPCGCRLAHHEPTDLPGAWFVIVYALACLGAGWLGLRGLAWVTVLVGR